MLGVQVDAGVGEVRKRYLQQALRQHPDKGGDGEEFRRTQEAYELMRNHAPGRRGQAETGGAVRPEEGEPAGEGCSREWKRAEEAEEERRKAEELERKARKVAEEPAAWARMAAPMRRARAAYFGALRQSVLLASSQVERLGLLL